MFRPKIGKGIDLDEIVDGFESQGHRLIRYGLDRDSSLKFWNYGVK